MRSAFALLLVASGCDALFGLRTVSLDPDARMSDGRRDGQLDARDVDAAIDARPDPTCSVTGLGCANGAAAFTLWSGCYAKCLDQISYVNASARCQAWGGSLAIIPTAQEDSMVQSVMGNDSSTYWIGMQQMSNEPFPSDGWYWNDGVTVANARWYMDADFGNEPNDGPDKIENGEEQCGWYSTLGWGDATCTAILQYLCKK